MNLQNNPAQRLRISAILWLCAGLALLVAGLFIGKRQTAFFAIAVVFFAVSSMTSRRARLLRRNV